jgi:hypothetical protein
VNGEASAGFLPNRGIRQGCPLSPYLFVVAINELSISLQHELYNSNLTGITLGPSSAHPSTHFVLQMISSYVDRQRNMKLPPSIPFSTAAAIDQVRYLTYINQLLPLVVMSPLLSKTLLKISSMFLISYDLLCILVILSFSITMTETQLMNSSLQNLNLSSPQ